MCHWFLGRDYTLKSIFQGEKYENINNNISILFLKKQVIKLAGRPLKCVLNADTFQYKDGAKLYLRKYAKVIRKRLDEIGNVLIIKQKYHKTGRLNDINQAQFSAGFQQLSRYNF